MKTNSRIVWSAEKGWHNGERVVTIIKNGRLLIIKVK